MKKIKLTQGKYALVDDSDYEWLNQWNWCYSTTGNGGGYAMRASTNKKGGKVIMHRLINKTAPGRKTDHRDGNTLNNQRYNLRDCTHTQNLRNSRKRARSSSRYKGVCWHKRAGKWMATYTESRKTRYLGLFKNEVDAATAYDKKVIKLFGEFACTNFPRGRYV